MQFSLADRWIQSQLQVAIRDFRTALDTYRFDIAAGVLYEFIWNQFCDWYLELTKPVLTKGSEAEQRLPATPSSASSRPCCAWLTRSSRSSPRPSGNRSPRWLAYTPTPS